MHDRLAEQEQDQLLRDQEMLRAQQADRLNNILFVRSLLSKSRHPQPGAIYIYIYTVYIYIYTDIYIYIYI